MSVYPTRFWAQGKSLSLMQVWQGVEINSILATAWGLGCTVPVNSACAHDQKLGTYTAFAAFVCAFTSTRPRVEMTPEQESSF